PEMQMQMRLLKELTPERMKHAWEISKISVTINENIMANTADSIFLGLYGAYQNVLLSEKSYGLAKKAYEREKIRYDNGLITELGLKSSFLDMKESENGFVKSERNYENSHRQFNRLSGLPVDYRFLLIGTPWPDNNKITLSEGEAVANALTNRMEIWDLQRQIRLTMQQIEIYRYKDLYKYHKNTKENFNKAVEQMEEFKIKLHDTEYKIEKEIRQAYKELEISYLDLEMNKQKLLKQKNQLDKITDQYNEGQIPESVIEQMELAVSQIELSVNMSMITAMNKRDRFYRAISAGPGY
ncbi:MAG: TolC family protein, partial [Ruminiclostridium sp.]|nr:TolC family protein [Ruminiclostridium sp.]